MMRRENSRLGLNNNVIIESKQISESDESDSCEENIEGNNGNTFSSDSDHNIGTFESPRPTSRRHTLDERQCNKNSSIKHTSQTVPSPQRSNLRQSNVSNYTEESKAIHTPQIRRKQRTELLTKTLKRQHVSSTNRTNSVESNASRRNSHEYSDSDKSYHERNTTLSRRGDNYRESSTEREHRYRSDLNSRGNDTETRRVDRLRESSLEREHRYNSGSKSQRNYTESDRVERNRESSLERKHQHQSDDSRRSVPRNGNNLRWIENRRESLPQRDHQYNSNINTQSYNTESRRVENHIESSPKREGQYYSDSNRSHNRNNSERRIQPTNQRHTQNENTTMLLPVVQYTAVHSSPFRNVFPIFDSPNDRSRTSFVYNNNQSNLLPVFNYSMDVQPRLNQPHRVVAYTPVAYDYENQRDRETSTREALYSENVHNDRAARRRDYNACDFNEKEKEDENKRKRIRMSNLSY